MPNQNYYSFLWQWMAGCLQVPCVNSRCPGTDPAVSSSKQSRFSTVSMKLGTSSEQEEQCFHATFSQKHRHHSKDDLEVPFLNQELQPTSLSWDNHLHTLYIPSLSRSWACLIRFPSCTAAGHNACFCVTAQWLQLWRNEPFFSSYLGLRQLFTLKKST